METWCGEEGTMGSSWDQEEEVEIGMWSNSQQDNRSHDQSTWNYKHKGSNKVCSPKLSPVGSFLRCSRKMTSKLGPNWVTDIVFRS